MTLESGVLSNSPPSQYGISGSPFAGEGAVVIGKLGGRLPLATTCSAFSAIFRLSKLSSLPEARLVAVRINCGARTAEFGLSLSKLTYLSRVLSSGPVS